MSVETSRPNALLSCPMDIGPSRRIRVSRMYALRSRWRCRPSRMVSYSTAARESVGLSMPVMGRLGDLYGKRRILGLPADPAPATES
ncbi:hypothetical protein AB0K12_46445 [Nonomuraea sp. NPDC049419]|uniref:hypothetical protein n=1 Tax=Nonomuraea sp. NPDC049419 TaxID=3155772 RepID=UPI0034121542